MSLASSSERGSALFGFAIATDLVRETHRLMSVELPTSCGHCLATLVNQDLSALGATHEERGTLYSPGNVCIHYALIASSLSVNMQIV